MEPIVALAKKAGCLIMDIYQSDFRVGLKEDSTPLTAADLASHHCIVEGLESHGPRYPILSEESESIPFSVRSQWETFWLIDPLDGTKQFIKRNGEFTVNIALIHQHQPVLGVVYAPAKKLCYFASEGCGAFKQVGDGLPEIIRVQRTVPSIVRVVGSRSHGTEILRLFLHHLENDTRIELLSIGSSLKICHVAEGSSDLHPRTSPTSEWDTAAAHCIVKEAGGEICNFFGHPLFYNTKVSLLNPYFLVYGDTTRNWLSYATDLRFLNNHG